MSMATVMGPTPPGTGVRAKATSATSGCTSPRSLPSTRFTPTSTTMAPSRTHSFRTRWGRPTATTRTWALRVTSGRSWVLEWARVTVASSRRRSPARGFPTMLDRPTTTTSLPLRSTP